MAWIKTQNKTSKTKVVPVNRTNFPELNVTVGNCHSVQIRENGFYAHTSGDGCNGYVRTGNFNTKKYKTLVVNCSNSSWGSSVPSMILNANNQRVAVIPSGGSKDITIDLAGRTEMNLVYYFSGGGQDNAWMDATLNSVTFIS